MEKVWNQKKNKTKGISSIWMGCFFYVFTTFLQLVHAKVQLVHIWLRVFSISDKVMPSKKKEYY